jgi:hypothetical protein
MTRLSTPQYMLQKMTEVEVADMIEKYIDFYKVDKNGNRRSVHLPTKFVRHFMRRDDKLPICVAVSSLPIVLLNGTILAPPGLHRESGIQFRIPTALLEMLPLAANCDKRAVRQAMRLLTDEWLVDVSTDYAGKATIVAAALTLIERSMLDQRPCFWITAGRRGGGKTTVVKLVVRAVTGDEVIPAAWSASEEERRKALLAYFMAGLTHLSWDNIPRGLQISCPHIERSCTAAYYSDRKLGVSERVATSASTIHFFTGNNIGPKGDLASRSLQVRLHVDRVDPENREFAHPDPIGWTDANRAELMVAFYTILLGNPQLRTPLNAPAKTRFKNWWRLIGSAVEHAAKLNGEELDFERLFLTQEGDDEEAASLADVLQILLGYFPNHADGAPTAFEAGDVADIINDRYHYDPKRTGLREFLYPGAPDGMGMSPKSVGRRLQRHIDEPVKDGEMMLTLRTWRTKEKDPLSYYVEQG